MNIGQIEYSQRQAWTTMGIISAVLIPAIILICVAFVYIRKNQKQDGSAKSWRFSDRSTVVDNNSPRQLTPLKAFDRAISPTSDSSTNTSGTLLKRRSYDRVYRTHEPLPNRPNSEFEEKVWDLKEPNSLDSSDSITTDTTRKTASPSKESDV